MTELKAQLLTDLPYHRIEQPRRPNKYWEFFGSYIALPLMSILLVLSLLVLFLLVKTYFSNSYMYALQDNLDNKNSNNLNIGAIMDTRYDQFHNNRKTQNQPSSSINKSNSVNSKQPSMLEKAILARSEQTQN